MRMFYSPITRGFYDSDIHGDRTILVPDPNWAAVDGEDAPLIEVPNVACRVPEEAIEITAELHAHLMAAQSAGKRIEPGADGSPVAVDPPPPTLEQVTARLQNAVQAHLNAKAQAVGYDSIFAAVTYADEPAVKRFQTEGKALRAWRSRVWQACYQVLDDVQAQKRPVPTAEELIAELPALSL